MPNLPIPAGARFLSLPQIFRPNTPAQIRNVDSNGLFSPLQPITPLNPTGEYLRQRQLIPGENLIWQPKGDETAGYWILREFADSCDLLRIVIDTVLDRLCSIPWELRLIAKPGEKTKDLQARQSNDPRIAALTTLLKKPDGVYSYSKWARQIWEDALVLDAAVIWKQRDVKGRIANLRAMDGATFNRLVTEEGFVPQPPDPSNQQVLYGIPWFNVTAKDIFYWVRRPRTWKRYGFSPVEAIFVTVGIALQRQQFTSNYYTSGNIPEALCFLPSDLPIDRVKEVQSWFDTVLAGDLSKRRRLTFLPGYGKSSDSSKPNVIFPKEILLKDPLDEWLFQIFCYHLGTTPQAMLRMVNRATAQSNQESAEEEGMMPKLKDWKDVMDLEIIQSENGFGFADIEFAYQERREPDLLKQAQIDNMYVGKVVTINETRQNLGKDPLKIPEADMLGEFTINGFIPLAADQQADRASMIADATRQPEQQENGNGNGNGSKPPKAKGKNNQDDEIPSKKKAKKRVGARIDPAKYSPEVNRVVVSMRSTIHKVFLRQKDRAKQEAGRILKNARKSALRLQLGRNVVLVKLRKDDTDDDKQTYTPEEIADAIFDALMEEFGTLPTQLRGDLEAAAKEGVGDGLLQISITDAGLISASNDQAEDYARDRAAAMVGMKYDDDGNLIPNPDAKWQISDTTRARLQKIIEDSFSEETSMSDVENRIQQALSDQAEGNGIFSEARADMIARTETSNALVQGNLGVWKKSGVVTKVEWLLSNDHEGEDECDDFADGSPYNLLESPVPIVDTHPNCSCSLAVVEVKDVE